MILERKIGLSTDDCRSSFRNNVSLKTSKQGWLKEKCWELCFQIYYSHPASGVIYNAKYLDRKKGGIAVRRENEGAG